MSSDWLSPAGFIGASSLVVLLGKCAYVVRSSPHLVHFQKPIHILLQISLNMIFQSFSFQVLGQSTKAFTVMTEFQYSFFRISVFYKKYIIKYTHQISAQGEIIPHP